MMQERHLFFGLLSGCLALLLALNAGATPLLETLPNGLKVRADYQPGSAGRPAVLLLHGFLQTHEFPTVQRLSDSLQELGYPVFRPTLSLGIDGRRRSLPCEAIQNHSLDEAVAEIGFWVDWLVQHGHSQVVLIGHSSGSIMEIAYLRQPRPEVKKAILISLTYFGQDTSLFQGGGKSHDRLRAEQLQAAGDTALHPFRLAYCKEYVSTAAQALSYYAWDKARVLQTLAGLQVPVEVVIGSADSRMNEAWKKALAEQGVSLSIIDGADHFFDAEHEFDLLDRIEVLLQGRAR
ncbi:alpha/beta hydrolase [Thiohalobacter sp. IOR34]|uniref:alpha/beta hydrolase n=1 Tax=Thiohalobacter sp. IOR34 TaxID=3057176 RepID=UPI0025B21789|nr:alpha/beta hydrolase [Thiohalobacter sp. IOR34]WJW76627.1 alpha/beta hydrolase [Thiohalobacter sp. IOR34]